MKLSNGDANGPAITSVYKALYKNLQMLINKEDIPSVMEISLLAWFLLLAGRRT
jgi:hypothetical protein